MESTTSINKDFYKGKRVLVTGHTGFKGSWLSIWLHELGAKVMGVALDPQTSRDNYVLSGIGHKMDFDMRADIRDATQIKMLFRKLKPDIVFHLAAQPLVRLSYHEPAATFETNVMGTINIMEAMRETPSCKVGVMITTDKCYENHELMTGYREDDSLGGYDPYSASKGAAEIAIQAWRRSFMNPKNWDKHGKSLASVRAGNVIGGGDWAEDRIVPDCIRALESGQDIAIRSPKAIRPWQHVLEPLGGYLLLAQRMWEEPQRFCQAYNFGPEPSSVTTVWEMAQKMVKNYGCGSLKDASDPNALHEAKLLLLDITKARAQLKWSPRLNLDQCMKMTVYWYKHYRTENVYDLCAAQIGEYSKK